MIQQSELIFWSFTTGVISCLATGLGAIPVHFMTKSSNLVRAFASAFAAGMMISASVFSLVQEGIELKDRIPSAPFVVIIGLLLGAAFFWLTSKLVHDHPIENHSLAKGFSKKGLLIFIAMFVHSIPEGIAIGVGFATGNFHFGMVMAMAIAVHNIPEGIAVSLPLKSEGHSTFRCAVASILTSLPQAVLATPAALLTWMLEPLLPVGLGFAGGAMIYLVTNELIPEAIEEGGHTLTSWGVMFGLCGMLFLTNLLGSIPIQ